MKKNFVYLKRCCGFVKIGVSKSDAISLSHRDCPFPITLIGVFRINDAIAFETQVKRKYADKVSAGGKEWFKWSKAEIGALVQLLKTEEARHPRLGSQDRMQRHPKTPQSYSHQTVFNDDQMRVLHKLLIAIENRGGDPNRISRAEIRSILGVQWCPNFINKNLYMRTSEQGQYRLPVKKIREWASRQT